MKFEILKPKSIHQQLYGVRLSKSNKSVDKSFYFIINRLAGPKNLVMDPEIMSLSGLGANILSKLELFRYR